ncbi:protein DMR6-LIKE OXYGENASE 2-like [Fagus crenata]
MADIPESFMQPLEDQPNLSVDVEFDAKEIPVFDISSIDVNLISEIREACKIWGFFQVINHGVDKNLRQKLETVAHNFFQEPLEQKKLIKRDELNPTGFHDSEHTQNVRDWKEVFICFTQDPTEVSASHLLEEVGIRNLSNRWPQHPSSFRETCEEYGKAVSALALRLLHMISLSLGLPAERLDDYFQNQGSYLLVNNYPTCPNPKLTLGVGPHKDPNAFTILAQDEVGGLEVKRKSDGSWIPVKPIPEAFIINIGDCMQVLLVTYYRLTYDFNVSIVFIFLNLCF